MTLTEIEAAQAEIRRQVSEVDAAIADLKEPPTPEKWVPKEGKWVYCVDIIGGVELTQYCNWRKDHPIFPDTPEGKRDAERAGLRIRSLQHGKPPFEEGQKVFCVNSNGSIDSYPWEGDDGDMGLWRMGRLHATLEEAEAWSAEFNDSWSGE